METEFRLDVRRFSNIWDFAGALTDLDFSALLVALGYGDQSGMSDVDRRDMDLA